MASAVLALPFTPKGDVDLQYRYVFTGINNSLMPSECLLTNSWISLFSFTNTTCRTLNYTAVIAYTYPTLAGTGNAVLCLNASGVLYRGNATGCP